MKKPALIAMTSILALYLPVQAAFKTGDIGSGSAVEPGLDTSAQFGLSQPPADNPVGPTDFSALNTALANGNAFAVSSGDALAFADTDGDGELSGSEFITALAGITGITSLNSGGNGKYAQAYAAELASLSAGYTLADLQNKINTGNTWAVDAPNISGNATLSFNGKNASSTHQSSYTVLDGKGVNASSGSGNASLTVSATHDTYGDRSSKFTIDDSGNLALNGNIQDLESGTYNITISAQDSNAKSYEKTGTQAVTLKVYNENGCILNNGVDGTQFNAATDSIEGAAVTISGNFNSNDLLFIQGASVTTATLTDGTKRYTSLGVSGVTKGEYNPTTGILRFYGTTSEANWVNLFKRVGYIYNASSSPSDGSRKLVFSLSNRVPFKHDDGSYHFYEYYQDNDITFSEARVAAAGKSLFGMTGYLATPTSSAEQTVLTEKVQGIGWLGACDRLNASAVRSQCGVSTNDTSGKTQGEGHWYWVTGPEKMTKFGTDNGSAAWTVPAGNNEHGSGKHTNTYQNWNGTAGTSEPNNCCSSSEHYLHVWGSAKWNDFAYDNGAIQGYLVEWGGLSTDPNVDLDEEHTYSIPSGDSDYCAYVE